MAYISHTVNVTERYDEDGELVVLVLGVDVVDDDEVESGGDYLRGTVVLQGAELLALQALSPKAAKERKLDLIEALVGNVVAKAALKRGDPAAKRVGIRPLSAAEVAADLGAVAFTTYNRKGG